MNLGRRTSLSNPGLSLDTRIWPRENIKERSTHEPLMIHSWTTHEGGPWDIDSFINSFSMSPKVFFWFLGFLRAPLDPLGFTDEILVGFQINGYHEWFVYQLPICADCLRMSIIRSFLWLLLMKNSWPTHEPLMNGRNSWTPTAR